MSDPDVPPLARVVTAFTIIAAILVAFLYRVAVAGEVQPWMVVLISLLGIAAAAAVLGRDAVRTAAAVVDGLRQ